MKKFALIVAGGSGLRMGSRLPKQFLPFNGKPIIIETIRKFYNAVPDIELKVVIKADFVEYFKTLHEQHFNKSVDVVVGGKTRFESVQRGLDSIAPANGVIAIHDAVRPLISEELIERTLSLAILKGNAIPVIPVQDSLRQVENNKSKIVPRANYRYVQTPQCFQLGLLKSAYSQPYSDLFTDCSSVVETYGKKIFLVEGDKKNIKITTSEDLKIANALLE